VVGANETLQLHVRTKERPCVAREKVLVGGLRLKSNQGYVFNMHRLTATADVLASITLQIVDVLTLVSEMRVEPVVLRVVGAKDAKLRRQAVGGMPASRV
jgi:hypothetical protein